MRYLPTKAELDRQVQDVAGEVVSRMERWKFFATQMNSIPEGDLTALGYNATEIAYLRSFQAALINIELMYRNQSPANSDDPSYFIGQMTRMIV
jgi:hypothetical protein